MRTTALTQVGFREAASAWLESRRFHISPRTFVDYGYYIKFLGNFFGEMRLHEITGDQVRAYQRARRATAGPGLINKECGVIMQMRARIGIPLADYQPLQMPKDWETPGRALTDSERDVVERICEIIVQHPQWKVAALAALLSLKSGLTRCEMLSVKLKNCNLEPPSIEIPRRGAKRIRRERTVQLLDKGGWALEQLIRRATEECGAGDGDHFLFPFQNKDHTFDPTKPAKGYRAGMRKVFELSGVTGFRPNDFRHDAVSRALKNPKVSTQMAVSHFGWISPKMIQRYYHAAQTESRIVAEAIEIRKSVKNEAKSWMPRNSKKTG